MGYLPALIPILAVIFTSLGLTGMMIANHANCPQLCTWGRRLFLLIFCLVGVACLAMALTWPRGVLPCSLAIAALFLAMLWHPANPVEEGHSH